MNYQINDAKPMHIVGALSIHAHITNHCPFSSLISAPLLLQSQPDTPSFSHFKVLSFPHHPTVNSPLSFHHIISVHLTFSNHTDSESRRSHLLLKCIWETKGVCCGLRYPDYMTVSHYIHLMAELHLSYKYDIMTRCMAEMHTKEVNSRVDVFWVTRSILTSSPVCKFPSFAEQLTEWGQGHTLSCSYMEDFQVPHHHTWLLPLSQNTADQLEPTNLIRAREKSNPVTMQGTKEDINFSLISHSLLLEQPLSITANYWGGVCKTWWACPHKWQQMQTIYRAGKRK